MAKKCFVPHCANSSATTPTKIFISVPRNLNIRKNWFIAARRLMDAVPPRTALYCCEDHFNLQDDMENYWQYQFQSTRVLLKKGIVPHKFACQPGRDTYKVRPLSEERARKRKVEEMLYEAESSSATVLVTAEQYKVSISEKDPLFESDLSKPSCSKDVQPYVQEAISRQVKSQKVGGQSGDDTSEELQLEHTVRVVSTECKSFADASVQTEHSHYRNKSVQVSKPIGKDVAVSPFLIEPIKKTNVGTVKRKLCTIGASNKTQNE